MHPEMAGIKGVLPAIGKEVKQQEENQGSHQSSRDLTKETKAASQPPGITADKGFTINRIGERLIHGVVPASEKYGHRVTPEEEEDNTNISHIRVVVENMFSQLKQWMILGGI